MKKLLGILVLVLVVGLACTAFAKEVNEGDIVNWGDKDAITKIGNHVIDKFLPEKSFDATCTEPGQLWFDCKDETNQLHQHILNIPPYGHVWASEAEEWKEDWGAVVKKPTCKEEGLAEDECLICGLRRPEVTRVIDKLQHEYNDEEENLYIAYPATCIEKGYKGHLCILCGEKMDGELKANMVPYGPVEHDFTDWKPTKTPDLPTCSEYGAAERACRYCGMHQILDEEHAAGDPVLEELLDKVEGVALLNSNWKAPETTEFDSDNAFKAWEKTINFEYDVKKWLNNCYERTLTYTCPYCGSDEDTDPHQPIVITLKAPITKSHVFNTIPEPDIEDGGLSLAPSCLNDGYYIYLCKYDETSIAHGHAEIEAAKGSSYEDIIKVGYTWVSEDGTSSWLDHRVNIVKRDALGHDFGDETLAQTYTKDGKEYGLYVQTCKRCYATKEEVREIEAEEVKNGLVRDDDGVWRYYVDGEFTADTKIVTYDGAEFWIVKGVLAADATGMTACPDGTFYFLNQGQILRVSQIAEYNGEWFKVANGTLDTSANGLYDYDGGKFVFAAGRLIKSVNGLWQNPQDGKWYFLAGGQVQAVSQVVSYDGAFFVVENGVLNSGYNGTIEYDGATFKVVAGQLYPMD